MAFPANVYLGAFVLAAFFSTASVPFWRRWCRRRGMVDDPGERKIHSEPMPLAGGLAVLTGMVAPLMIGAAVIYLGNFNSDDLLRYGFSKRALELGGILLGAMGMLLIGLLDDQIELRPASKFAAQLACALAVAAFGVRVTLFVHNTAFSYALTALWILTVINAFNFMDNMNGLCGGLGAIAALSFGAIAAQRGQYLVAATCWLIAGALLGFLPFNYPTATVFLGDSGSHLTGYLMAILAILPHFYTLKHQRALAVLAPLLVLAVPLGDLAWVVWLRWRMGKPFYIGDTNHLSHRLVRRGLSKPRAVAFIWLLALVSGALAFLWQ